MSNFLDLMEAEGFNDYTESTTFESSESSDISRDDFENISGLPFKMSKMTIFELVSRYGGPMQLDKYAGILSKLMTAMEKDQKSKERRNELIEKDFVISNVFKYLNIFMDGMFDAIESENPIIIASVKADEKEAAHKIIEMRKKTATKLSKEAKKSINDELKRLKNKYDDDSDA